MTSPATRGLPPSGIKKEGVLSGSYTSSSIGIAIPRKDSNGGARKDGIGFSSDEFLGMITHTPPAFSPGSLTMPLQKRGRSGSISSRLLSATDLEEKGLIDRYQKGVLKDMIISGDEALQKALEKFDAGDSTSLEALLDSGALNRKSSVDLLDDMDLGFLNIGSLGNTPKDHESYTNRSQTLDEWDELGFDSAFADVSTRDILDGDLYSSSLGDALPNSLPSMGLGITPPNTFAFAEDFLENKKNQNKKKQQSADGSLKPLTSTSSSSSSGSSTSRPIGIPGSSSSSLVGGNHPRVSVGLGLHTDPNKDKNQNFVGAYSPESRRKRIEKFLDKRQKRVWRKEVKYDVRKNFADSRLRVKGRFVKKEDEQLLRELLSFT